jgi:hypothetical protein
MDSAMFSLISTANPRYKLVPIMTDVGLFCSPCTMHAAVSILLTAYSRLCTSNNLAAEQSQSWAPDLRDQEDVAPRFCRRVFLCKAAVVSR